MSGSTEEYLSTEEPEAEELPNSRRLQEQRERALSQWRRLVRKALRLRRLQRLFGLLGNFVGSFGHDLRAALRRQWPR
jgi:hypothetical protein